MREMGTASEAEADVGRLELIGTQKQVAWAREIAERVLAMLDSARASYVAWGEEQLAAMPQGLRAAMRPRVEGMVGAKVTALAAARDWALGHEQARWWIDVADKAIGASDMVARQQREQASAARQEGGAR